MNKEQKKAMLIILDGWGINDNPAESAISSAKPPYFQYLMNTYPNASLITYGTQVGLPEGQMGNSEVGHINIGAGRIVYQELQRIHQAIETGELKSHQVWRAAIEQAKRVGRPLHLIGLYSDGGVHSHTSHFHELIKCCTEENVPVVIHAFTDGRDTDPQSGILYIERLLEFLADTTASLGSIIGRYYAMDRDQRWERIKVAYDAMLYGQGEMTNDVLKTIQNRYEAGETDEFIKPIITSNFVAIEPNDVVFCVNFRTDRCRQITQALTQIPIPDAHLSPIPLHYTTMTEYSDTFVGVNAVFRAEPIENSLGQVFESHGLTQFRIAETEKYPHVTFFFSGGREEPFKGESRKLVPSPKVATYDLKPEMSAYEIKNALINHIKTEASNCIILNFANADMVGHTGVFAAAEAAVKAVDKCLSEIVPLAQAEGYQILIIADHGNSDYMVNPDGSPNTAHSLNPVPIIAISPSVTHLNNGILADVAPTILKMLNIDQPDEMTGVALF